MTVAVSEIRHLIPGVVRLAKVFPVGGIFMTL